MKLWSRTLLKLIWGAYLVLTSLYCLLAFLPYTYYALIKAPAFEWMPWFVHHHAGLYWIMLFGVGIALWPRAKSRGFFLLFGVLVLCGLYLTANPFLGTLENNRQAYIWAVLALTPLILVSAWDLFHHRPEAGGHPGDGLLAYSNGVLAAIVVALLYFGGAEIRTYSETHSFGFHVTDAELTSWSLVSHAFLAIIILSILNLVRAVAQKTRQPALWCRVLTALFIFGALWAALLRFLENSLTFEGWQAQAYAGMLAASLTLLGFSMVTPFLGSRNSLTPVRRVLFAAITVMLSVLALSLPSLIHNSDWNGVLQATLALALWVALSTCIYQLRPRWGRYSLATILAVLFLAGVTYKALQVSEIFWARSLGSTDDDISRAMESYAGQDASFQLAHQVLGDSRAERCTDLCRILREFTNIRDTQARVDIKLVDPLVRTRTARPNIFLFVIDSLRPDYLGAYNPKVDFTPNLDAFARDSVSLHRAFTQYAGTTLSEPAIWAGAMLLHTHYLQPFSRVNGLEKLANTDGYQIVVSYDSVLSQLLSPSDDLVKLDTDKPLWNRFEVCSTIRQTESALDSRGDKSRPVLFYAQPMNVHQFAHNDLPLPSADHWRTRPGFNNRIAHEISQVDTCMGKFFTYLKSRGIYDNSIIILASDHGDATGEFGRFGHSVSLYPEIMRVPMIVHLPLEMKKNLVYDDTRISTLTDITPSLYYLLGHRPVDDNPFYGRPLFAENKSELDHYRRDEYLLASDVRAAYGILADNGRFLYFTYDSPPESFLYDLEQDPAGAHNVVTDAMKKQYDQRIIEHLQAVADFYGYKPGMGSLLASARH